MLIDTSIEDSVLDKPLFFVFRVDSSVEIGMGHLSRCLTLAKALRDKGHKILFLTQSLIGDSNHMLERYNFDRLSLDYVKNDEGNHSLDNTSTSKNSCDIDVDSVIARLCELDVKPDWLIVDHYSIGLEWERAVKSYVSKMMVIDDLADRRHDCDLLLDQVPTGKASRYQGLVPSTCEVLIGQRFILLNSDFVEARLELDLSRKHCDSVYRFNGSIHVWFGGGDKAGHTIKYSKLLLEEMDDVSLHVIVSGGFDRFDELVSLSDNYRERFFWEKDVTNMSISMQNCTFAIGSPGMSTWERACLGLPSAQFTNAENQKSILQDLDARGLCCWLGHVNTISDKEFISHFQRVTSDTELLESMRETCLDVVDGQGVERTIAAIIENSINE